jgi:hypothetical protein
MPNHWKNIMNVWNSNCPRMKSTKKLFIFMELRIITKNNYSKQENGF